MEAEAAEGGRFGSVDAVEAEEADERGVAFVPETGIALADGFGDHVVGAAVEAADGTDRPPVAEVVPGSVGEGCAGVDEGVEAVELAVVDRQERFDRAPGGLLGGDGDHAGGPFAQGADAVDRQGRDDRQDGDDDDEFDEGESVAVVHGNRSSDARPRAVHRAGRPTGIGTFSGLAGGGAWG